MAPPSILIIEDEEYLRNLYAEVLCDYAVESVDDGLKALKKNKRYDLYVVDIGLPGMDGLKTIENLKKAHGDIKTIVVTGYDVVKYSRELEESAVNGILQKPFKVFDLLTTVEEILEK
ncbi:MAG: response regulator [Pseudomonadota bacterium]